MLIRRAELDGGAITDVRIERGIITAIGQLGVHDHEPVLEASSGLLLPGLHDHHIHVAALAASLRSVRCGPPDVTDKETFAARLQIPGHDWLRATGYHESVAGMLDASTLDRIVCNRPLRIQHRCGRMWFFNSAALDRLLAKGPAPVGLERDGHRYTGRLLDEDAWLQRTLGSEPPSFAQVGAMLASRGVTGLTEMSPANDSFMARHFRQETSNHSLPQRTVLAGRLNLSAADTSDRVLLGPAKLHLHEAALPTLDDATDFIRRAHEQGRGVAVHCATEVEILFTLAAFNDAGTIPGDRIEHASIAADTAIEDIAKAGIAVVSQPHFIRERGDRYLTDVDTEARPLLYRLRAFLDADVTLAGGSDAPFGNCDPWASMATAVSRRTASGASIGESEALTPEQALDLFLRDPKALNRRRSITVGAPADLCLLDRSWADARGALSSAYVRATFIDGRMIFDRNSNNSPHRLEGMT
jgi:predicted amidohydrolase YtcJ